MKNDPTALFFFSRAEFSRDNTNWFEDVDPRLLILLDVFRFQWKNRVSISAHPHALGRHLGLSEMSDHNIDKWKMVQGVDVMPSGINTSDDLRRAYKLALSLGFTGVGVYPHWSPSPGLHLGTRRRNRPGNAATWGAVRQGGRQLYVSADTALSQFGDT